MGNINKKGFTLIELLAVIAILAILVVIAVPAVLNLFNDARKSAFVTQSQTIFKAIEQEIIIKQLNPASPTGTYCHSIDATTGENSITLDGTNKVAYKAVVSTTGEVTSFIVSDDTYIISLDGPGPYSVGDVTEEVLEEVTETTPAITCP